MSKSQLIIAVDGFSSTGKSTIAKIVAKKLNVNYIDTGAMYRAVTYYVLQNWKNENVNNLSQQCIEDILKQKLLFKEGEITLNGRGIENKIRSMAISTKVSYIAKVAEIRTFLVEQQREMAKTIGIIMDGRDIGTVVFPNADFKFFMTASDKVRAQRRYDEIITKGEKVSFESVLENLIARDKIDSERKESPLKQAEDAIVIDNSEMTIEEQVKFILNKIDNSYII